MLNFERKNMIQHGLCKNPNYVLHLRSNQFNPTFYALQISTMRIRCYIFLNTTNCLFVYFKGSVMICPYARWTEGGFHRSIDQSIVIWNIQSCIIIVIICSELILALQSCTYKSSTINVHFESIFGLQARYVQDLGGS